MKKILIVFAGLFVAACGAKEEKTYTSFGKIGYRLSREEAAMLDSIQEKTFTFFWHEHHPELGIVKDRAISSAPSSIASTGFGIP